MADLMIKTGTYTNKEGEQKNNWVKLGVLKKSENGHYILVDPSINLAGCLIKQNMISDQPRANLMVSVFSDNNSQQGGGQQKAQTNQAPVQQPAQSQQDGRDDDIPF